MRKIDQILDGRSTTAPEFASHKWAEGHDQRGENFAGHIKINFNSIFSNLISEKSQFGWFEHNEPHWTNGNLQKIYNAETSETKIECQQIEDPANWGKL